MTDPFLRPTDDEIAMVVRDWAKSNGGMGAVAVAIIRLNSPIYQNELDALTMHDILNTLSTKAVIADGEGVMS